MALQFVIRVCLAAAVLSGLSTSDVLAAEDVWNIADHGAEPGDDVTEILRHGFATQHEHGLPVFIPGHLYRISDTITLPFRDGVAMAGVTVGRGINPNSHFAGAGSRLAWVGEDDRPMLVVQGSHIRIAGGLSLIGVPPNSQRPRCQTGILVTKPDRGLGTGKMRIDWLLLENFEIGMQFGTKPGEGNCDEIAIEQLTFRDCAVGYRSVNSQSMGHRVGHVHAYTTPVVFDFLGGGMLSLDSATLISGTLLRLQENNPTRFSPGSNNASFRLDEVKVDAQAGRSFRLVDMVDPLDVDISSTGGRISGPIGGTAIVLRGPTALVLRDWANIRAESIEAHGVRRIGRRLKPNVLLDRCKLRCQRDELLSPASTTEPTLVLRDCYNGFAEPVE